VGTCCPAVEDTLSYHKYLRRPTLADAKIINSVYEHLWFPACLGAVDCSG